MLGNYNYDYSYDYSYECSYGCDDYYYASRNSDL